MKGTVVLLSLVILCPNTQLGPVYMLMTDRDKKKTQCHSHQLYPQPISDDSHSILVHWKNYIQQKK